ncbi:MAG: nitroreductase family protein [Candidatus Omnitrophota bacterium]|nr:nitroreductase family protein [Candidatus Omnitrophota bacterium]
MDLLDLIKSRRTIRKYKDKKVPRDLIEKVVEAARWAPSAHNTQPWKIIAMDDKEKIGRIAGILDKKADDLFSGFNVVMRNAAKNLKGSPSLLFVYADGVMSEKFGKLDPPYSEIGDIFEIQSIAAAIENMQLASHSMKLGMVWYGMPLFCEKEVNDALGEKGRLMAIMGLGYPDEEPEAREKKSLQDILKFV